MSIRSGMTLIGERRLVSARLETPVGPMVACASETGVCLFEFGDRRALSTEWAYLEKWSGGTIETGESPHFDVLRREMEAYFAGRLRVFRTPLDLPGTPFQKRVWDRLCAIPYGETLSYDAMAKSLGSPGGQRAVGRANGQNRVAIVVPCHRVIEKSGALRGYGGGLERKRWLLEHEGALAGGAAGLFTPSGRGKPEV